jgi:hypothetical protein
MALENSSGTFTYLGVFQGKLTQRVKEGTECAVERTTKPKNGEGKKIWELVYDKLSGRLTAIEFKESDFGKEIHFVISDGPEKYKLQLPFSSGVAKSLIMRLPNCDLSKDIEIHTGLDTKKDKTFSYVSQDGQTVKMKWTKDNPGDLPPMVQIEFKGKLQWDDTAQLKYLDGMLINDILPKLGIKPTTIISDELPEVEPSNDLPF